MFTFKELGQVIFFFFSYLLLRMAPSSVLSKFLLMWIYDP